MFIKHVLGVGTDHPGLYGDTAGYYGTVEQQGRLTLHLHTVLWIKTCGNHMRKILRKPIMSAETGGKGFRKSCDVRERSENIGEPRK